VAKDLEAVILTIKGAVAATLGDCMTLGVHLRGKILERTARGVDVDGREFAPYSGKGPYYYCPAGQAGRQFGESKKDQIVREQRAAKRLHAKLRNKSGAKEAGPHLSRTGRSLVFPGGYRQFKEYLGRTTVDLTGPRAPHMLQSMRVRCNQQTDADAPVGQDDHLEPCDNFAVGIYDGMAARASGHQDGNNANLPQRRFIGASKEDISEMTEILAARMRGRIKAGLSKQV